MLGNFSIKFGQFLVAGVHIVANTGKYATGSCAFFATAAIFSSHFVHIGAGASEVADRSGESRHLREQFHFSQDAFLGTAGDEFSLVRIDRAKTATAKTAAMRGDGKFDHFESGNGPAFFVAGMRCSHIRVFKTFVQLAVFEWRIGRIDDDCGFSDVLQNAFGVDFIGFDFCFSKSFKLRLFALQTIFVAGEF